MSDTITAALQAIRQLDDAERLDAERDAESIIIARIGDAPRPDDFLDATPSRFPPWVGRRVIQLILVVLVAASALTVFRQFTVGRDYFRFGQLQTGVTTPNGSALTPVSGINDHWQGVIAGVATALLGEFIVMLSIIAAKVYFEGKARAWFAVPVVLGMAMTLVGNWVVEKPHDLFGFLMTITPPITVMFLSFIIERLMFVAIETKHAADTAYRAAKAEYEQKTSQPQMSEGYRVAYANALRKAIFAANVKGQGATARRELMLTFTNTEWRALVGREMSADDWLNAPLTPVYAPAPMDTAQPAQTIVVTPVAPAQLTAPITAEDVGLPARKPRAKKPKAEEVSLDARPTQKAIWPD